MILSIIVAMTNDRVIGLDNKMPWHLPADLAWFKKNTLNKPVIVGRKTFESIGRPLPNRHNIIISRMGISKAMQVSANSSSVTWVTSLEQAIDIAKTDNSQEAFIIGGGNIYQQVLPYIDRLYLTHIEAKLAGDTYFPEYYPSRWRQIFLEKHQADDKNIYNCRFEILEKQVI